MPCLLASRCGNIPRNIISNGHFIDAHTIVREVPSRNQIIYQASSEESEKMENRRPLELVHLESVVLVGFATPGSKRRARNACEVVVRPCWTHQVCLTLCPANHHPTGKVDGIPDTTGSLTASGRPGLVVDAAIDLLQHTQASAADSTPPVTSFLKLQSTGDPRGDPGMRERAISCGVVVVVGRPGDSRLVSALKWSPFASLIVVNW